MTSINYAVSANTLRLIKDALWLAMYHWEKDADTATGQIITSSNELLGNKFKRQAIEARALLAEIEKQEEIIESQKGPSQ